MPTISEFITNFGWPEFIVTVSAIAITCLLRETSDLGHLFKRKKRYDSEKEKKIKKSI